MLKIPGKARHEGFQLAVMGRMGKQWRRIMRKIMLLVSVLRYFPTPMKESTRWPIPKDILGLLGTRPISLGTDQHCTLVKIMGKWLMEAAEKAGLYRPECKAYREAQGCVDILLA